MDLLLHGWPFAGLLLAATLLVVLFREPRVPDAPWRLDDPAFVLRLLWPMYLLHQFEEHGIDVFGRRFAFLADLCAVLGHSGDVSGCPADASVLFAVNVVACPMAFVLPLLYARSRPLLAAMAWSVPLVNGLVHIGSALARGAYNPGLVTSLLLFVPCGLWMLRTSLRAGVLTPRQVPVVFACGAALHAVLMGSLVLYDRGVLTHGAVLAINALNGAMPLLFAAVAERLKSPLRPGKSSAGSASA